MGPTRNCSIEAGVGICFPTLSAQNAERMGHGGFVLWTLREKQLRVLRLPSVAQG